MIISHFVHDFHCVLGPLLFGTVLCLIRPRPLSRFYLSTTVPTRGEIDGRGYGRDTHTLENTGWFDLWWRRRRL